VRLIAEFHGGEASAVNLPDGSGVRFIVRLIR
jgi:signal transduction histidine kinase